MDLEMKEIDYIVQFADKLTDRIAKKYNVSKPSVMVLLYLAGAGEDNTAKALCNHMCLKSNRASVIIDKLVIQGMLRRENDSSDRRIQRLYLTEKGQRVAEECNNIREKVMGSVRDAFTEEETELLRKEKEKVIEVIKKTNIEDFF